MAYGYSTGWTTKNHNAVNAVVRRKNDERTSETGRHYRPSKAGIPDETVLAVLRAMLIDGMTTAAAAERFDVTYGAANQWRNGSNKGRLLDQVLREKAGL